MPSLEGSLLGNKERFGQVGPRILVIVPAYNEEGSLPGLLDEITRLGYDVIVVDDASKDGTGAVARDKGVPVLSLPVNLGIGGGVQAGFIYAARNGYDIVAQVDGDGQHDPAQLVRIISPVVAGMADCVIGSRFLPEAPDTGYQTPLTRRLGMHFSTAILQLATGMRIHDTTSGFRALNRSAFTYFSREYPVDHPEAEALLMLHQAGYRIMEVPVHMRCRTSGQSLFTFVRAVLYPLRVIIGFMGLLFKKPQRLPL